MTKTNDMIALITAVKAGDAERVKALLAEDVALANAKDADGTSAVLIATYWGKRDINRLLLAAKPELSVHEAAAVGDEARVMGWIKAQPELLDAYSQDGFTPLQLGAFFSHADVVKFLLARGANMKAVSRNPMKLMALHSAAAANHIPITKLLLANGADVNAKQAGGFTPIHAAAQSGNAEMMKLLLEWGADPSSQTDEGKTARDFAAEGKHTDTLKLLEGKMFTPRVDHVEWATSDLAGLKAFMSDLFGWQFQPFGESYFIYYASPGATTVGLMHNPKAQMAGGTPHVSIEVASIDETVQKALALGGSVAVPKQEIGPELGSFGVIAAPDGNLIGLYEKVRRA